MVLFGKVMLGIAALFYAIMSFSAYSRPMAGGDARVGAATAFVFGNLILFACFAAAAFAIDSRGGLQWVGGSAGVRFMKIAIGLVCIMLVLFYSAAGGSEGPPRLRWIFKICALVLPVVVLWAGVTLLLNDGLRERLSVRFAQWSLMGVAGAGALMISGFLLYQAVPGVSGIVRRFNKDPNELSDSDLRILQELKGRDIQRDLIFVLVHTSPNNHPTVRESTIAKIKTRVDWQEELVRRLDSRYADQVFIFLASNEVDNKALFPEAIRAGILQQAKIIRDRMEEGGSFVGVRFHESVDNVLATVKKYEGMGVDFRPAMQTLRAALNGPPEADRAIRGSKNALDDWLAKP